MADLAVSAVLWDIDGTLITSGGAVARLFLDAVESLSALGPDAVLVNLEHHLHPRWELKE